MQLSLKAQLGYQTAGVFYYDASLNELEQDVNAIEPIYDGSTLTGFCLVTSGYGINSSGSTVLGTHITKTALNGNISTNGNLFIPDLLQSAEFKQPLIVKTGYAYLAGRYNSGVNTYLGILRIELSTMSINWQKTESVDFGTRDIPMAMAIVSSSLYLTGRTGSATSEFDISSDGFLMKLNASNGNVSYVNRITGNVTPEAILAYQSGTAHEIVVTGNIYTSDFSDVTLFAYKADDTGAEMFYYKYDIKGIFEEGFSIIRASTGDYIIIGTTIYGCSNGPDQALALKIENDGDVKSAKVYGSTETDQPNWIGLAGALTTDSDDSYYIAGFELKDDGKTNCLVIGVDGDMNATWATTLGLSDADEKLFDIVTVCNNSPNYDCSSSTVPAVIVSGVGDIDTYTGQTFFSELYSDGTTEDDCDIEESFLTITVIVKKSDAYETSVDDNSHIQNTFSSKLSTPPVDNLCFDYYDRHSYLLDSDSTTNYNTTMLVYPNPSTHGIINIQLSNMVDGNTLYYVYDFNGQLLKFGDVYLKGNLLHLKIPELHTGTGYIVRLITNKGSYESKFILD